jgi:hypothetical protein
MAAFNGDALSALRQALTLGDTVDPAGGVRIVGTITLGDPGVAATSLGKAEDAPHTSGDVGVLLLGVRNDNSTTLTTTDLDYSGIAVDLAGRVLIRGHVSEDSALSSGNPLIVVGAQRTDTDATQTSASGDAGFFITDSAGRLKAVSPITTPTVSAPAADARASASIALASGFRHVCRSLSFGIHTVAAPTATTLNVTLRDGATGAGTVIRQWGVRVPATADTNVLRVDLSDLSLAGTAGTAMTLEFSAALTGTVQWCNLSTYQIV